MRVRIATRGSPLARWQAEHVGALLRQADPSVDVDLVLVETLGDRTRDRPIHELGGQGVFVKEVQAAVLDGRCRRRGALGEGPAVDARCRSRDRGRARAR